MKKGFVILILLLFSFVPAFVPADMGPKPFAGVYVTYDGKNISEYIPPGGWPPDAALLYCSNNNLDLEGHKRVFQLQEVYDADKDCYWIPTFQIGPGEPCMFIEETSTCGFGYSVPSVFKFAIYIPDLNKTFVTNEISNPNFEGTYTAELSSDGTARIYNTTPVFTGYKLKSFIKSFIITIIIELFIAFTYISKKKLSKKILIVILIANLISLPIVSFVFPLIKITSVLVILLSEIFAILFETFFIYYFNKKIIVLKKGKSITLKESFILSMIMNIASLVIGTVISIILSFFGI